MQFTHLLIVSIESNLDTIISFRDASREAMECEVESILKQDIISPA